MRKTKKPVVTLAGLLQAVDEAKTNKENDKIEPNLKLFKKKRIFIYT